MNKESANLLSVAAEKIAENYSRFDRPGNFNKETFRVDQIIPMSDSTATVIMEKNTGKRAAFFFYYVARGGSQGWKHFVPTDAHILGMQSFGAHKLKVEQSNWEYNWSTETRPFDPMKELP